MAATTFQFVGGIGLFLLGMVLLTDGLKAFAGSALQRGLMTFTATPTKAFVSGTVATAALQSSSATAVTVIGFVSAGLLTFSQAIGVVFGASLGTTVKGWIIAVLGLTISIGTYALSLVGVGALLRLAGRGRARTLGWVLAGFGLIFVGIDALQEAMSGVAAGFDLADLPDRGLLSHLGALLAGATLTVVMQSSSAAVVMTLTALHSEALPFDIAAPVVIGAAIGTTVTGALAAIGRPTAAKRTALAHVLFNSATGLIAIALLPLLMRTLAWAEQHTVLDGGALSLATFYTAFILIGVLVFLPFTPQFSRFIERLLPERGPAVIRHLDHTVLSVPAVALDTSRRALVDTGRELLLAARGSLQPNPPAEARYRATDADDALRTIQAFFARIPPISESETMSSSRASQLLAIDHMLRLVHCLPPPTSVRRALDSPALGSALQRTRDVLDIDLDRLEVRADASDRAGLRADLDALIEARHDQRVSIVRQAASGAWQPDRALELLEALRWLDRVAYHATRLCDYLDDASPQAETADEKPAYEPPDELAQPPDPERLRGDSS